MIDAGTLDPRDTPNTIEVAAPTATVAAAPRTSRWLLAGLALPVALVVAVAFVAHRADGDYHRAVSQRNQAADLQAAQQDATDRADGQLTTSRSGAQAFNTALIAPQATVERLVQLADRSSVAAQHAQQAVLTLSPDGWNAAVTDNNTAMTEFNTDAGKMGPLLDQLPQYPDDHAHA